MNKHKSLTVALIILAILIMIAGLFLFNRQQRKNEAGGNNPEGMILFYSLACPHCQNVEQYINDNKIKEKYNFAQLEVSADKKNSDQLLKKAKACGLDTQGIGVPLLWTGNQCLMGDESIIDFFKK